MGVLGFWVNSNNPPEILAGPHDHLGTANVTWINRWRDLAHQNEMWQRGIREPGMDRHFSRVPERLVGYLPIELKFADAMV